MARGRHSSGGMFSGLSFGSLFTKRAPGRHQPGRPKQPVSRGRTTAKYPGRTRGVSARVSMGGRAGGRVHSGYNRFAGVRHFGWHQAPKFGG